MLQEARATGTEEDLKADIAVDPPTLLVILDLDQPDIPGLDPLVEKLLSLGLGVLPPQVGDIDASLDPGQLRTRGSDELINVLVGEI